MSSRRHLRFWGTSCLFFPIKVSSLWGEIIKYNLLNAEIVKGKKVLIIDMDFRKPKIHKIFNIHNENGIVDVVTENIKFEDAIYHHESGVDVLVRGSSTPQIELFLESDKLTNFINELKEKYDAIILDCPPTTVVTDSILISKNTTIVKKASKFSLC